MENENKDIWVFLSHSHLDYDKVILIRDILENQNFRPLMFFLKCLEDDKEIDSLIKREIDCRNRFIYCKSPQAEASEWVQKEVNYIRSKDRIFETIDIDLPRQKIVAQIQDFIKKSAIYFSYPYRDIKIIKDLSRRLSKYELRCLNEEFTNGGLGDVNLSSNSLMDEVEKRLIDALNKGYVIFFIDEQSQWIRNELKIIIEKYNSSLKYIIPVYKSLNTKHTLSNDSVYKAICDLPDVVIEEKLPLKDQLESIELNILRIIFPLGYIFSFANSFSNNFHFSPKYKKSIKLYELCFEIAIEQEKNGLNSCYYVLAFCYENGLGTQIDKKLACNYYYKASNIYPQYKKDYNRLSKILYSSNGRNFPTSLRGRIISLCKKLLS